MKRMVDAYRDFWTGYVDFGGRASRGDYWWAFLAQVIVSLLLYLVIHALQAMVNVNLSAMLTLLGLASVLPGLAIAVRRLRDAGHRWTKLLWTLLPIVGWIVLIVCLCGDTAGKGPVGTDRLGSQDGPDPFFSLSILTEGELSSLQAAVEAIARVVDDDDIQKVSRDAIRQLRSPSPHLGLVELMLVVASSTKILEIIGNDAESIFSGGEMESYLNGETVMFTLALKSAVDKLQALIE